MASSLKDELTHCLQNSFDELESIWDYIGYEAEDRSERAKGIADRIQKTLFQVIQDENRFRIELETQIDTKKREIAEACQSLSLPTFFPPRGLSSYRLLKVLDEKANELEHIKSDRRKQFYDLRSQLLDYCTKLDIEDPATVFPSLSPGLTLASEQKENGVADSTEPPGDTSSVLPVPKEEDIRKLTTKVTELGDTYTALLDKFSALRDDILRIAADIDYTADSDFERAVLEMSTQNGEPSVQSTAVALSNQTLEDLTAWRLRLVKHKAMLVGSCEELRSYLVSMWTRLGVPQDQREKCLKENAGYKPSAMEALQAEVDRCQEMKWERMNEYLSNLRDEAYDLADRCFLERPYVLDNQPELDNEEAVHALEKEIDRLREVYGKNRVLYDTVHTYQNIWEQYLEVEAKMKDPAILSNRGGIMLKTDKEKKRLLKELPKVEQDVAQAICDYEAKTRTEFRLHGRRFTDYVQQLWREFKQHQDGAKTRRGKNSVAELDLSGIRGESTSPTASPRRMSKQMK